MPSPLHKNLSKMSRDQKASIVYETHTFNVNIDTREIFIHGHICDEDGDMGVDHRMSNYFIKNIRILEGLRNDNYVKLQCYLLCGEWPRLWEASFLKPQINVSLLLAVGLWFTKAAQICVKK